MTDDNTTLAMAAMAGVVHLTRILANRGLVSPNEVESIYSGIVEISQTGSAEVASAVETALGVPFVELRQTAAERWIGKGQTDPE